MEIDKILTGILTFGSLAIVIASLATLVIRVRKIARANSLDVFDEKKEKLAIGILSAIFTVFFTLLFVGLALINSFKLSGLEWFYVVFGSLTTGAIILAFYISFRLHYYQKGFSALHDKILYWTMLSSLVGFFIFGSILTEGFASHLTYPLYNGISWEDGLHLVNYTKHANLAWYALFIVGGAIFVYLLSDHKLYKKYGKHGLLESTFYVAFPSGIIGARLVYVIGNWKKEFAGGDFWDVFKIWNGGLTILGGALIGIIVGILWFKWRNKDIPMFEAGDLVIPTILLAQAIGRWGNFFNAEVHGGLVPVEYWKFLPEFILQQSQFSSVASMAPVGFIYAPLFWVEAVVNVAGYFIIAYLFGGLLKKYIKPGDLAVGYLIWYGGTRTFMEPLRYGAFNMGVDGAWSWKLGIVFAGVGVLLIVINHLVRMFLDRKKNISNEAIVSKKANIIEAVVIGAISLVAIVVGTILFVLFEPPTESLIDLVPHNIGLIMLILGAFLFTLISLPIVRLVFNRKSEAKI